MQTSGSSSQVAIATDSCALLTSAFVNRHNVHVASMRIHIGDGALTDKADLDYSTLYSRVAVELDTRAWVSAPMPEEWLKIIRQASQQADAVVCIPVAASLSASYDSARVAADIARGEMNKVDIRVVDSGAISGALKMLVMDAVRAAYAGLGVDEIVAQIEQARADFKIIGVLNELNRIHYIANTPRTMINTARVFNIKPIVTFDNHEFRLCSRPFSMYGAMRRMLKNVANDLGDGPARFVVLHVDAKDRAKGIANRIRSMLDCRLLDISDFHPFVGFYAGRGAIGIAWHRLPSE